MVNSNIEFLNGLLGLTREEVTDLLFPHDNKDWAKLYMKSGVSTCALTAMAYLRHLGFGDEKELTKPYQKQIGMAVSNVVQIGKKHKLWLTGNDLLTFPDEGDIVLIGTGSSEHVLNVTGSTNDSGLLISVDGGQISTSTIAKRERMMVTYNGLAYLVDPATPYIKNIPNGRPIMGRLSIKLIK